MAWARALAAGDGFEQGPFFRAPLYVWTLAGILRVFGEGLLAPRILQCLFGTATTVLTYLVGRRAFDRRVGRLAAIGAATYWVLIYFDGELLIPTLAVPLDLLALYLTLGLAQRPRPAGAFGAFGAGLVWGTAAIARPNVLLLMPLLFGWLLFVRRPLRSGLVAALALTGGTLLPILPITAYNAWVAGDFALISTQAGVNLWIGNNPEADGITARVPGTASPDFWGTHREAAGLAEREVGRPLSPSEVSGFYSRKAARFALGDPGRSVPLLFRKLSLFWRDEEVGNNQPVRFFAHHFSWVARLSPLGFSLLAPLGLMGLALSLRRRLLPLWGFVLAYTAAVVAFFVCSRFRVPVLPPLLVLAAHALVWVFDRWRGGRRGAVAAWAAALAVGVGLELWTRPDPLAARAEGLRHLALGYGRAELPERAGPLFRRALELRDDPSTRADYAGHLEREGDLDGARENFERALAVAPLHPTILDRTLGFLLRHAPPGELLGRVDALLVGAPRLATLHYHRGAALVECSRFDPARRALEEARRLDPRGSRAQAALGQVLAHLERPAEALALFEEALANDRWEDLRAMEEFTARRTVQLLLQRGDTARARHHARAFAARHPGSESARDLLRAAGAEGPQ